jgi:hypothetical protein
VIKTDDQNGIMAKPSNIETLLLMQELRFPSLLHGGCITSIACCFMIQKLYPSITRLRSSQN